MKEVVIISACRTAVGKFQGSLTPFSAADLGAFAVREAVRRAAAETGKLIKADGRRESVESVEAMRKRGLTVHPLTPEVEAEWRQEVETMYPKIRGRIVPAEIFDEIVKQLADYRAGRKTDEQSPPSGKTGGLR